MELTGSLEPEENRLLSLVLRGVRILGSPLTRSILYSAAPTQPGSVFSSSTVVPLTKDPPVHTSTFAAQRSRSVSSRSSLSHS